MAITNKLASSLNRRDEVPNQELAKEIVDGNDKKAVSKLVENLHNKSRHIQNDCIKVIYEIGELNPKLISGYFSQLLALLDNKNNRLQWGAMTALNSMTSFMPEKIYKVLPKILTAADRGSVITNDHCVGILIKLCAIKEYAGQAFVLLNDRLITCPTNQLPMYAENALPVIRPENVKTFIHTLASRINDIEKESKRIRIMKVVNKLQKK